MLDSDSFERQVALPVSGSADNGQLRLAGRVLLSDKLLGVFIQRSQSN